MVENQPGAAGNIGMDLAAKSPEDGYALVMANSSAASNVSLYTMTFDVEKDLDTAPAEKWRFCVGRGSLAELDLSKPARAGLHG